MQAKKVFLYLNLLGGVAVLGSYVWGFLAHAGSTNLLWGGVPGWLKPYYSVGMLLAATGFFAFTGFIYFSFDPTQTRVFGRYGFSTFNLIYFAILFPSACWMPLTFLALQAANLLLVWLVRITLIIVALASISLLVALLSFNPRLSRKTYQAAIIGCFFFCLQTALLDATIWGSLFRLP